jgi:broad specificity phosphatase PhoE
MGLLLAFLLLSAGLSYRNNARPRRFRGRAELALTELGTEQARATGRRIVETWKPVAVYTSPLGRCVVTGQIIATILGITAAPLAGLNHLRSLASSPPRFATLAEVDI